MSINTLNRFTVLEDMESDNEDIQTPNKKTLRKKSKFNYKKKINTDPLLSNKGLVLDKKTKNIKNVTGVTNLTNLTNPPDPTKSKPKANSNQKKPKQNQIKLTRSIRDNKYYSGLSFTKDGILDEFNNLPNSIDEAIRLKKNLTLKQITSIMNLNGLWGEMFNVIHDNIQKKIAKHQIKITHHSRVFYVSLYNWYDLKNIQEIILNMLGPL